MTGETSMSLFTPETAHSGSGSGGSDLDDLSEADVWSACHGDNDEGRNQDRRTSGGGGSSSLEVDQDAGGLSLALGDAHAGTATAQPSQSERERVATSAPVAVPASSLSSSKREEDEPAGEWLPPHVYLARVHENTASPSVLEGRGRTLKGRDLTMLRDSVWRRTGFLD
ncbi:hypothetical protein MUK42_04318 [Musa troglodytarum]|uniref:Senescence regulator n=1 Tax=Musa troglodytarum TaxID=320322 RepID=A0A9E7KBI3_9LILI|nr:hypothetical protein MUK42_04318 [Musa troglodytarum]